MNKGKFASLIMLSAFVAGVASSSAVSARGDENFPSTIDMNIWSYNNTIDVNSEVNDDISNLKVDTENVDESTENETDLPEDLNRENNENKDYLYVDKDKKSEKNRAKKIMDSAVAVGGGTAVASMLVKSFIDGSSDSKSVGDTELTYKLDSELADTGNEPGNTNASSGNSPESDDNDSIYSPAPKSDTNPKSDYSDKNKKSDNLKKPGGIAIIRDVPKSDGNDSIYSPVPKSDTNPKSDHSDQNKKNNDSIVRGTFISILLVYLFICLILENKLKNKIITATENKISQDPLFNNVRFKDNDLEYKVITVMDKIFEKLGRNNIFALHKFKNIINPVSNIFAFYLNSMDETKLDELAHFICGLEEKGLLNLDSIISCREYKGNKGYRDKCRLLFDYMISNKGANLAKFIGDLSDIDHQLYGFTVFVSSLDQKEIFNFVDFINSLEEDGFDVFAEILSYFGRICYKIRKNNTISNFVKDIVTRKDMAGIINELDKNKVRCLTRTHEGSFRDIVGDLNGKGAKNYLNVIFKLDSTGMDTLKKVIDKLDIPNGTKNLVDFINNLEEVEVDRFAKYINGLEKETELDKFITFLNSSEQLGIDFMRKLNDKGAKNYLNVIFKLNSTGMDALKRFIRKLDIQYGTKNLVIFINNLEEVEVDRFAEYINGLEKGTELDKFINFLNSSEQLDIDSMRKQRIISINHSYEQGSSSSIISEGYSNMGRQFPPGLLGNNYGWRSNLIVSSLIISYGK